jgi:hypothetical protein
VPKSRKLQVFTPIERYSFVRSENEEFVELKNEDLLERTEERIEFELGIEL